MTITKKVHVFESESPVLEFVSITKDGTQAYVKMRSWLADDSYTVMLKTKFLEELQGWAEKIVFDVIKECWPWQTYEGKKIDEQYLRSKVDILVLDSMAIRAALPVEKDKTSLTMAENATRKLSERIGECLSKMVVKVTIEKEEDE